MIEKSVRAKAIPRTLFYEKQDVLMSMLLDGGLIEGEGDIEKIYYSESQMQANNFWKSRASAKNTRGCAIF